MEPMRLLVTDAAAQPPRQATAWLIMTLGKERTMAWLTSKWDGKIPDSWPSFADGRRTLARWIHPNGKSRVFLVQRLDGRLSKYSEVFSEEEFEMCWLPQERGGSLYDSTETAERNIGLEYPWTKEVKKEPNQSSEPTSGTGP